MNKAVKIVIAVFIVIIIGAIGYYIFPKSYITMNVAPDTVNISVDGGKTRTVKTGSTMLVIAGKHTYTLSRSEFDSTTITLESGNNETKQLLAAMNPQTDAARALLNSDASQAVLQQLNGPKMEQAVDDLSKNYPIIKVLPIYARLYDIASCQSQKYPNDKTKIAICVDESQSGLEPYVRKDIESRGYNPDDYEIIYTVDDDTTGSPAGRSDD